MKRSTQAPQARYVYRTHSPADGQPRRGDMFCLPNHMPLLWSFDLSPFRCYRHGAPTVLGTIRLTGAPSDGSLGGFFRRNESLHHHRIKSSTRQRHSPAWSGQEKRRRRPAHHENGAAHFRAQLASSADLGAGAKEVCAHPRHRARS